MAGSLTVSHDHAWNVQIPPSLYYKQRTAQQIELGHFVPRPLQHGDSVAFTDAIVKLFADDNTEALDAALPNFRGRTRVLQPLVNEVFDVINVFRGPGRFGVMARLREPTSNQQFTVPVNVLVLVSLGALNIERIGLCAMANPRYSSGLPLFVFACSWIIWARVGSSRIGLPQDPSHRPCCSGVGTSLCMARLHTRHPAFRCSESIESRGEYLKLIKLSIGSRGQC